MKNSSKAIPVFLGLGTTVLAVMLLRDRGAGSPEGRLRVALAKLKERRLQIATRPVTSELIARMQKAELVAIDLRIEAVELSLGERVTGSAELREWDSKVR